ncbi:MAG: hypothetical protein CMN33_02640 [Saprospirales bacterium]|nr:hypothetical protein [Saprospirales bacterium]|tara:strand:- start:549 stop:3935 length:3387 start_codon:yes stop_codon:yes gene_type:complete
MALVSPGVQVSVVDESFYTPAEPGTTPMIFVATAQDKTNAAGTGTAPGTTVATAGTPYLLTSQRDLADTFGDPIFKSDSNNNMIHGGELNEYGLQAAYSYLGIANRAYVVRADVDLAELEATATAPAANPTDGTYWLDTANTLWGIQEWNGASVLNSGQVFTNKAPIVITDSTDLSNTGSLGTNGYSGEIPSATIGSIGSYAVVATTTLIRIFYRNSYGTWVLVGSDAWTKSWSTVKGTASNPSFAGTAAITINGTSVTVNSSDTVSDVASTINGLSIPGVTAQAVDLKLCIYSDGTSSGADDSSLGGPILIGGDATRLGELGIAVGTYYPPALQINKHTSIPEWKSGDTYTRPTGSVWLKTTTPNLGASLILKKWNDATKLWETISAPLYSDNQTALYELDPTTGGSALLTGAVYAETNVAGDTQPLATIKLQKRRGVAPTSITGGKIVAGSISVGSQSFTISATDNGSAAFSTPQTVTYSYTGAASDATVLAGTINSVNVENVTASVDAQNKVTISHALGGEIRFVDTDGVLLAAGFTPYVSPTAGTPNLIYVPGTSSSTSPKQFQATLWSPVNDLGTGFFTSSATEVTGSTANGRLWYNSIVDEVDIMVHNGSEWCGLLYDGASGQSSNASPFYDVDATKTPDADGPIVSATAPLVQSDGTALVNGDIWISTADLENYPKIYKFNADRSDLPIVNRWFLVDSGDQTSENGILFADARYSDTGAGTDAALISDLLATDYVDPDCPDPALYPKGMLLWNLRRSGFNVKKYVKNYINTAGNNTRYGSGTGESMASYFADRWVTESANQEDGSGTFGRKAQRKVVVQALQATVNSNQDIRDDESRLFNLMSCPAYPELIGEMKSLNYDRGLTAFVLGDSPFRLTSDATSINNWATNTSLAVEDNDNGLVTSDPYLAVYYPSGFTSDNFGNNVVVPSSHMMMRTIALSDQVSFPWFAPAGTRRGGITNASSTGFITSEGEFKSIALNEGQRDTLYQNAVNPITFITGAGLVAFGQKTRQLSASSLDRINVARLVIYLRSQLNTLAKPYLFEPNDKITRDEIKGAAESLMLELVGQRALYDFLVVCDESNNTPSRIDRNELHLDIAIEPVKAVEFIYIPLRLKNTGEIAGL